MENRNAQPMKQRAHTHTLHNMENPECKATGLARRQRDGLGTENDFRARWPPSPALRLGIGGPVIIARVIQLMVYTRAHKLAMSLV
eukprot:4072642-Pyramimonas_sp.AAC.1